MHEQKSTRQMAQHEFFLSVPTYLQLTMIGSFLLYFFFKGPYSNIS